MFESSGVPNTALCTAKFDSLVYHHMFIGQEIEIEGISLKGKNRVREQGSTFSILEIKDRVLFSDKLGPWLQLKHRWVHATEDKDFRIKK